MNHFRFILPSYRLCLLSCLLFLLAEPIHLLAADVDKIHSWVNQQLDSVLGEYKYLHANPEVSFQEQKTATYVAKQWRNAGFTVTENVGDTGIVALLKSGNGPTLMLRTDLDALPVTEATGLPFASTKQVVTESGAKSGVMHACGHDIHMSNLIGVARFLGSHQDLWQGTVMLIGQPAEERGAGAKAMLEDGLFTKFPTPDFALALHCESSTPTGKVAVSPGYTMANVDSVDITVNGRGGHGSAPESTIDPIAQACELVVALQTIVSREISPREAAVVTVGSIHGGTKHNIIGDSCHLQLTVRSYNASVRKRLLGSIKRKALAVAESYGAPAPEINISEGTPALRNDDALAERVAVSFRAAIGRTNVLPMAAVMGGEDFSRYGLAGVPIVMYRLGVISPERLQRFAELGRRPPSLHSATFYPDARAALRTSMVTMISASLDLLQQ